MWRFETRTQYSKQDRSVKTGNVVIITKRVQELRNSRNCSSACFITLDAVVGVHGGRLTVIHSWMKATGRKSGFYLNLVLQISKREPQVGTMVWPFSSSSVKVEKLVSFISYLRKCNERERSQCLKTRKYNQREWSQFLHLGGAGDGEVWLWVRPLQRAWDDNRLPGPRKTFYNCKSMFDLLSQLNPLVKSCDHSKFQADIPIVITL